MKRSCKSVDITDQNTVYPWVLDCVLRHKKRHDFRALLCGVGGMRRSGYTAALERQDNQAFYAPAARIAAEADRRIRTRSLGLPPVVIRKRVDKSSGKTRLIGRESAMQQVLDYIAVHAAADIWRRRIVPQQASSIPGRGQVYGMRMIQGWVTSDNRAARWASKHRRKYSRKCRYFVKLDVKKCYQSLRLDVFMAYFRRDCGNDTLLWLWETLLASHRVDGYRGFMIGALPSQWACQYIMSFVYRYAMGLTKERRGRKVKLLTHGLIYMDDMLLTASSYRDLKTAVPQVIRYAREAFGLTIKASWHIRDLDSTPIDMMGYVVHAGGVVTIRPRVFLRARRAALRVIRHSRFLSVPLARRLCSYKGYFKQSDSRNIMKKLKLTAVFRAAARTISDYDRRMRYGNLQSGAAGRPVYAAP